jgi:hypothetical protein
MSTNGKVSSLTDVQNNVIKGQLDNIIGNLFGYTPALDDLVDLSSGLLRDTVYDRRVWRVEVLKSLLLDTGL